MSTKYKLLSDAEIAERRRARLNNPKLPPCCLVCGVSLERTSELMRTGGNTNEPSWCHPVESYLEPDFNILGSTWMEANIAELRANFLLYHKQLDPIRNAPKQEREPLSVQTPDIHVTPVDESGNELSNSTDGGA